MTLQPETVCFACLALGQKYRRLAKQLAADFGRFAPDYHLLMGTDVPSDFAELSNVEAFLLKSRGILHCYHDKRFLIERGLAQFQTVILTDADSRLTGQIFLDDEAEPGVYGIFTSNVVKHSQRYNPARLKFFRRLAKKLDFDLEQATFVGESLFAVCAPPPQANAFLENWDKMARYLELNGVHAGEGNVIGMAALKAELPIRSAEWLEQIGKVCEHMDASQEKKTVGFFQRLQKRVRYHLRLNQARFFALGDFRFFYR
ncbi:MAG: hypothetical protein AAFR58_25155 [Cyanobacteria bacterium J06627_28]